MWILWIVQYFRNTEWRYIHRRKLVYYLNNIFDDKNKMQSRSADWVQSAVTKFFNKETAERLVPQQAIYGDKKKEEPKNKWANARTHVFSSKINKLDQIDFLARIPRLWIHTTNDQHFALHSFEQSININRWQYSNQPQMDHGCIIHRRLRGNYK